MVYSARTPDEFAYQDELQALARAGRIDLHLSVTRHHGGRGWPAGRGRIGRDHVQQIVRHGRPVCFICGPTAFVRHTRRLLIDAGLPQDRVRVEAVVAAAAFAAGARSRWLAGLVPSCRRWRRRCGLADSGAISRIVRLRN